jgi:hypothetical protein
MAGIVTYASNLEGIVTADTAAEIKTAVDATRANLIGLAKAGDTLNDQLHRRPQNLSTIMCTDPLSQENRDRAPLAFTQLCGVTAPLTVDNTLSALKRRN